MIFKLGACKPNISHAVLSTTEAISIDYAFAWAVGFYHKSGGLKKDLVIFGSTQCPIKNMKIELNKRLMGAAVINMSYIDIPYHADDYVIIDYKGNTIYRGLVDHAPDIDKGQLKLVPYSKRLKEVIINKTYTAQTASAMLNDIITDVQTDTSISWNSDLIDTGETTTYSKIYNYVPAEKAISEIVSELSDREWGVTVNNVFSVYQPSTGIDDMYFQTPNMPYSAVKAKINWNKIDATRYQVLQKVTGGKVERAGEVGTGGLYPAISLEALVRKKEKTFTIDTFVSSTEALDLAYSHLTSQIIPETISVKNFNVDRKFLGIGERIQVQGAEEKVLKTIVDCDSTTNWTGATLDTTDYTEGSGSISFSASSSGDQIVYDFGEVENFRYPERFGMMVKGSVVGSYLELGFSNDSSTLFDNAIPVPIYTAGVWQYRDFPRTTGFRYWGLNTSSGPGSVSTVKVDQISAYLFDRKLYTGNVVKMDLDISPENDRLCNLTLSEYDEIANQNAIDLQKRVESIETVNKST